MGWTLYQHRSDAALVAELAPHIAALLQQAIERRGRASIAVSGGSTPKALFTALSKQELPWQQVTVSLADERWVDEDHPDSNAGLVHAYLLQNRAAEALFVGLKCSAADPFAGSEEVQRLLMRQVMPLDLVILGLGEDGHTASLIPGSRGLEAALAKESDRLCCGIDPPEAPHLRMTLSLPALLAAHCRILHFIGQQKYQVLSRAMQDGAVEEMPVRGVLHQASHPIDIYYAEEGGSSP